MIILYCYDIVERQKVHNYFRDRGLAVEASPPGEFRVRSFAADVEALLMIGDVPPGYISTLDPSLPIFTVGRYQLGNSFHFREYTDPRLLQMLSGFSSSDPFFSYNDILFGKVGAVLFLGYDMKLTPTERAILHLLITNADRNVHIDELRGACIGDSYAGNNTVSKHISQINRKAMNIGGRKMIFSPAQGYYRVKKYI